MTKKGRRIGPKPAIQVLITVFLLTGVIVGAKYLQVRQSISSRAQFLPTTENAFVQLSSVSPNGAYSRYNEMANEMFFFQAYKNYYNWNSELTLVNPNDLPVTITLKYYATGGRYSANQNIDLAANSSLKMNQFATTESAFSIFLSETGGRKFSAEMVHKHPTIKENVNEAITPRYVFTESMILTGYDATLSLGTRSHRIFDGNLIVINPNEETISGTFHLYRAGSGEEVVTRNVVLPAKATFAYRVGDPTNNLTKDLYVAHFKVDTLGKKVAGALSQQIITSNNIRYSMFTNLYDVNSSELQFDQLLNNYYGWYSDVFLLPVSSFATTETVKLQTESKITSINGGDLVKGKLYKIPVEQLFSSNIDNKPKLTGLGGKVVAYTMLYNPGLLSNQSAINRYSFLTWHAPGMLNEAAFPIKQDGSAYINNIVVHNLSATDQGYYVFLDFFGNDGSKYHFPAGIIDPGKSIAYFMTTLDTVEQVLPKNFEGILRVDFTPYSEMVATRNFLPKNPRSWWKYKGYNFWMDRDMDINDVTTLSGVEFNALWYILNEQTDFDYDCYDQVSNTRLKSKASMLVFAKDKTEGYIFPATGPNYAIANLDGGGIWYLTDDPVKMFNWRFRWFLGPTHPFLKKSVYNPITNQAYIELDDTKCGGECISQIVNIRSNNPNLASYTIFPEYIDDRVSYVNSRNMTLTSSVGVGDDFFNPANYCKNTVQTGMPMPWGWAKRYSMIDPRTLDPQRNHLKFDGQALQVQFREFKCYDQAMKWQDCPYVTREDLYYQSGVGVVQLDRKVFGSEWRTKASGQLPPPITDCRTDIDCDTGKIITSPQVRMWLTDYHICQGVNDAECCASVSGYQYGCKPGR